MIDDDWSSQQLKPIPLIEQPNKIFEFNHLYLQNFKELNAKEREILCDVLSLINQQRVIIKDTTIAELFDGENITHEKT